jgi:hypothetical protein
MKKIRMLSYIIKAARHRSCYEETDTYLVRGSINKRYYLCDKREWRRMNRELPEEINDYGFLTMICINCGVNVKYDYDKRKHYCRLCNTIKKY